MGLIDICIKYRWWFTIIGILTLWLGVGFVLVIMGIMGFIKSSESEVKQDSEKNSNIRKKRKSSEDVEISGSIIKKPVKFFGGHKSIVDPTDGWLAIVSDKLVFKNANLENFEINFADIKEINIVDDSYTPSLGRGFVTGFLGGGTDSQSFRPHKSVLQVKYNSGKRTKELCFDFSALTWAGSVEECRRFYAKLNGLLD